MITEICHPIGIWKGFAEGVVMVGCYGDRFSDPVVRWYPILRQWAVSSIPILIRDLSSVIAFVKGSLIQRNRELSDWFHQVEIRCGRYSFQWEKDNLWEWVLSSVSWGKLVDYLIPDTVFRTYYYARILSHRLQYFGKRRFSIMRHFVKCILDQIKQTGRF